MYADAFESILKDCCKPADVRAVEAGSVATALRTAITDSGFLELLADESCGGAAIAMHEFYPVVSLCGAYAVPLPLAQTMVARLFCAPHEWPAAGMITLASSPLQFEDGEMRCSSVPFGMVADHVIAAHSQALWLLPVSPINRLSSGVRGGLGACLQWGRGEGMQLSSTAAVQLQSAGAVLHAGLLAGAMKRVFDMTLQYGNDRVQFGKSIGKFQAIQHQFSVMAEHVLAASIAAEAAMQCERLPSRLACAVAKSRTSEAAQLVASIAHAIHGAIGVTEEFDLQIYTRRLHEWRIAHGSEVYWNGVLGQAMLDSEQDLISDFVRTIAT